MTRIYLDPEGVGAPWEGGLVEGWTARPSFGSLPSDVVERLEERLAARVVGHRDAIGGMSPAVAAVLRLTDGRSVFVKVLQRGVNAVSETLVEREWHALALLPDTIPYARRVTTGDLGGWLLTAVEAAPGTTVPTPWSEVDLRRVLAAYARVGAHRAPDGLGTTDEVGPGLDGWEVLAGDPERCEAAGIEPVWAAELAQFLGDWPSLLVGDRLVHGDARADNLLVSRDGVVVVDWSFASCGPVFVDPVQVCLDALVDGSPDARRLAVETIRAGGEPARRYAVGFVGMLTRNSTNPPHVGLPTFRLWQRQRAEALWPFLDELAP